VTVFRVLIHDCVIADWKKSFILISCSPYVVQPLTIGECSPTYYTMNLRNCTSVQIGVDVTVNVTQSVRGIE